MKHSMTFGLLVVGALLSGCAFSGTARVAQPDNLVWVCHGNHNPTWRRVSSRAAEGHARHGDLVSQEARPEGERCGGGDRDHGDHGDRRN